MLVNDRFNLTRINIFTARDDHVFQAIQDEEETRTILIANVSGAKRSVTERPRGLFPVVPIAAHDIGPPSHQFALLSGFNFSAGLVDNTNVDARTGATRSEERRVGK